MPDRRAFGGPYLVRDHQPCASGYLQKTTPGSICQSVMCCRVSSSSESRASRITSPSPSPCSSVHLLKARCNDHEPAQRRPTLRQTGGRRSGSGRSGNRRRPGEQVEGKYLRRGLADFSAARRGGVHERITAASRFTLHRLHAACSDLSGSPVSLPPAARRGW